MLNCVLSYVILSTVTGSVFSYTVALPHEKSPEWEQPVVISRKVFPPHSLPQHPPYPLPQNEFKEIIGIELQRIPFHEGQEHETHKEHDILEHRKHEIFEHTHEPHEPEFFKPHVPPDALEHDILSHELPSPDLLEHDYEEFEQHHHGFHDVLEHEERELERREHERRAHEIMSHEHAHEREILEHKRKEHDISSHELPHELHHPPWEDPDFVLSEEEHHRDYEHEFHHEELFPEVSRRRTNRRNEVGSREEGSRRSNSNFNRRDSSNRRENSNRQGSNDRRENSNRQGSRRREGGSNINTEELFPRRNRQNNRRNNSNSNRRSNNNRESSRRNSNIEELSVVEEEIILNPEEIASHEISRPERDVVSYFNNERESFIHESSVPKQSGYQTLGFGSNTQTLSRPSNNDAITKFGDQQGFIPGDNILSNHGRHFGNVNSQPLVREGQPLNGFKQQRLASSNSNQGHSNPDVKPVSNLNEYSNSGSSSSRPDLSAKNIFIPEEEYLTLDSSNSQRPKRPIEPSYSSNEQGWNQQGGLVGGSRPFYSNSFSLGKPDEFSNGENSRPNFLGSRPGSGKPIVPGSLSGQVNAKPNRPGISSSGFHANEDHRPKLSNSSSSGFYSSQEGRPSRPESDSSGLNTNQDKKPIRPSNGLSGFHSNQERPSRPFTGSSGHYINFEERPIHPSGNSSGHFSNQGNSQLNRPSNSHLSNQEENPRPHRLSSRPDEESSRPRPSNGNNQNNESDLISVQEDSWLWPNQSQDEDKQNRRALYSNSNKKQSTTTKRPIASLSSSNNKQHSNLKLLPTDSCGVDLGNKIIGGENTQLDEFPWMALLQHSSAEGKPLGFGCGGSLISPRYVLSAAHCIKGPAIGKNVRITKVRLGEFDTSKDVDCQGELCSPPPVDIAVEEIIVHPKYRATDRAQLNDIALIRLKENVKNSAYVSPICLPVYGNKDHVGERLIVAGWGKTSNGQNGSSSKTKQKVSVPVINLEECSPFYNKINIQLNNTQICAGGERGKDSCQGDSGGPLMGSEIIDNQVRWQVHGIVSFGPEDCGIDNVAGVYTKVSEYIDWILDNMKR